VERSPRRRGFRDIVARRGVISPNWLQGTAALTAEATVRGAIDGNP
jgi:hypothetical protein